MLLVLHPKVHRATNSEESTRVFQPGVLAVGTRMTVTFVATALDFAFSTPLALQLVSLASGREAHGRTATGTRFLEPPAVLLSVSDDGVVRLLRWPPMSYWS